MKTVSLALMVIAVCSRNLAVTILLLGAGILAGWKAGLFDPI